jgi:hypothetical protein
VAIRRKRLPPDLEVRRRAFDDLVAVLERARSELTEAVPGTRMPGRPLAECLVSFEDGLHAVERGMDLWRSPEVEQVWVGAAEGLAESLALAQDVRSRGRDPVGFEGLIGLIADLLAPLEAFGVALERFRSLRA